MKREKFDEAEFLLRTHEKYRPVATLPHDYALPCWDKQGKLEGAWVGSLGWVSVTSLKETP